MIRYALLLCCALSAPAAAQQLSTREAAVAMNRVEVPSTDEVALERVATGLRFPWSLAFLPDGGMLVSEKPRGIRLIRGGVVSDVLPGGPPDVYVRSDSGVLDVLPDPDFATNGFVYIAYAQGTEAANRTAIWKARLDRDRLTGGRVIFRTTADKKGPSHPGGRLLFLPDKTLLLSVGDGFDYKEAAQDMRSHLGKMLRLTREGGVPADNPHVGKPGVLPEIWSSGHRNVQGLAFDATTGTVWAHEHGPRGGDEINRLVAGANYGWPAVTHGIDYDGKIISERALAPEFARSDFVWSPSIAPSGLTVYRGSRYPGWDGKLFVGGLASRSLVRIGTARGNGLLVEEARMFGGARARIRDVRTGPDGHIYLLTDAETGELWRLRPAP